jgi:putative membrane protein
MFHMWDTGFGWWMGFGVIWMVLFWGAIIAVVIWGVRRLTRSHDSDGKSRPVDIARERYARGEITKEEFDQIKKDLS